MRALLLAVILAFPGVALAQSGFPNRPVTLTVGYPPGGGPDATARIVGKKLAENIGVTVVVENKPGAGGGLAAQHSASAPADGSTSAPWGPSPSRRSCLRLPLTM